MRAVFPQLPRRGPHTWAPYTQLGMEGFPPTGHVSSTANGEVPILGGCPQGHTDESCLKVRVLKNALKAPCSSARRPQLHSAVIPTTGLCVLNHGQRRPHSRAVHKHNGGIPTRGLRASTGHGGILTAPWKTHRWAPTLGQTSSPAHGRLPTHRPCAFNRACSGPHHRAVCTRPLAQWFPLAGSAPLCPQRGIPTHRTRTINCTRMGPQGCMLPSTAHQGFPTCGLCALNHA